MPRTNILNTLQKFISRCQTPLPDTVDSEEEKEQEEAESVKIFKQFQQTAREVCSDTPGPVPSYNT